MTNLKYNPKYPMKLRKHAESHKGKFGASSNELARLFKISRGRVYEWMAKYPDFKEAVMDIRSEIDDMVESALLKSALGYDYTEQKIIRDGVGEDSQVIQAYVIKKHKPADSTAQKLWLTNRRPEEWKEKQSVDNNGKLTITLAENPEDYR